ncbi:MAG: Fur family transcriptional regulator [Woeseiaceae bacterium]
MSLSDTDHNHEHCVSNAVAQAEVICAEQGKRLTALRRRVLELVWGSHKPVGAYDVLEALSAAGKRAAPPTVYRALDFLMEAGLVHRLDSLNAFIGCSDPSHPHHGQFLICRECRRVTEIDVGTVNAQIAKVAANAGFVAEQQMLEVQGVCRLCASE